LTALQTQHDTQSTAYHSTLCKTHSRKNTVHTKGFSTQELPRLLQEELH